MSTKTPVKAPTQVLLSHSVSDAGLAALIAEELQRAGIEVDDFRSEQFAGTTWADAIRSRLQSTSAIVLLLTQSSLQSPWTLYEAGAAMALDRPVYLVYDGIDLDDVPQTLQVFQAIPVARLDKLIKKLQRT